jgi:predicted dehydrogenase
MIDVEHFDAVSIVVPTSLHESVAIDCLKEGINVFVEKPISYSLKSAEK